MDNEKLSEEGVALDVLAPVVDVKLDEAIFNNLEQNMADFIETIKEKEITETDRSEKLDELIEMMIENEVSASEKALLDEQAEIEAKELAEAESLIVEEVDPDAVDLATLYKLLQEKMKVDVETVNSFDYLVCVDQEEIEGTEGIEVTEENEEVISFCNHLQLNNEKLDILIEQGQIVGFYGYIVIPALLITTFFYKFMKWFI